MQYNKQLLSSCFHVHTRLKANMAAVRCSLSSFKCLRLHSSGTRLVYAIVDASNKGNDPLLELYRDSISLRFFFLKPDRREYTTNLLRFLSILTYLDASYSIDFTGVYGYVIEALRNSWSFSVIEDRPYDDVLNQRIYALSNANAAISHEFVLLSRENKELEKKVQAYGGFCAEILDKAALMNGTGEAGRHAVLHSLGVDNAEINAVASLLAEKK